MTTKTTKHGVQTSSVTEVHRTTSPTFEEIKRLHNSSDVKPITELKEQIHPMIQQMKKWKTVLLRKNEYVRLE